MPKSLVIVESPAKARTINRYLGKDFSVKASMGHVRDLPKKQLGVDLKNRFQPTYELIPGKERVIRALRSAARGVDSVYIATDPTAKGSHRLALVGGIVRVWRKAQILSSSIQ